MDEAAKKTALRHITYGLYVIGTRSGDEVNAFTANWVTQASFEPPLVVVGVKKGTASQAMIATSGVFSVNNLASGQRELAAQFFKPVHRVGNKFGEAAFRAGETGCPILEDALSFFECRVRAALDLGDHVIYVGEVVNAGVHREGQPLAMAETGWYYGG
ncbi:MAG: flavin reductase [Clostridia bacterium]|nr:flavin reductase [Clostridia bacterium]